MRPIEVAYALSIGTKIIDLGWHWMTLNGQNAFCCRKDACSGAHYTNLNEDRPIISATKMILVSGNITCMGIFAGGFSWRRRQMRVGLSTTAIFGDLSGYFFGIFRDKSSNIIWRYATPYRPETNCKMNDLEWPWMAIWRQNPFSASTLLQHRCVFWSPLHKFEWK